MTSPSKVVSILETSFTAIHHLYFQTHACHWNVTGANFTSLHTMLESQYTRLWNSLDSIAERFRVAGEFAPTNIGAVSAPMSILPSWEMLTALVAAQESTILVLKSSIEALTLANDFAGADLLTGLLAEHEKECWMTRSSL